jgi:hypothetical protein
MNPQPGLVRLMQPDPEPELTAGVFVIERQLARVTPSADRSELAKSGFYRPVFFTKFKSVGIDPTVDPVTQATR